MILGAGETCKDVSLLAIVLSFLLFWLTIRPDWKGEAGSGKGSRFQELWRVTSCMFRARDGGSGCKGVPG